MSDHQPDGVPFMCHEATLRPPHLKSLPVPPEDMPRKKSLVARVVNVAPTVLATRHTVGSGALHAPQVTPVILRHVEHSNILR